VTSGHASSAWRKHSIRETRPGGRVPPAGTPRRSTRNPEPGHTAFCTAPIAGRLQVLPQKKRTVCGDAIHAERGEFSRERNFVDGPHADLQPGILHPRDELLIHRETAIQIETVEVCRLRLHNERVGRGRTRDRRIAVIGPPWLTCRRDCGHAWRKWQVRPARGASPGFYLDRDAKVAAALMGDHIGLKIALRAMIRHSRVRRRRRSRGGWLRDARRIWTWPGH
jgi:hypothetical protein